MDGLLTGDILGNLTPPDDLLLGDILGGKTSPDDLLLGATPPIVSDPLGVSERLLYSLLGEDILGDSLLDGDLFGENLGVLEVLRVLELLPDNLLPEEGLTDRLLETRSLEGE